MGLKFFRRKLHSPTWEEVRARILKAIEEEKHANAVVHTPMANDSIYPETGSANEDRVMSWNPEVEDITRKKIK